MRKVVKIRGKEPCDDPAFLGEFSRWSLTVSDRCLTPEKTNSSLYCRELHRAKGMNMLTTAIITQGKQPFTFWVYTVDSLKANMEPLRPSVSISGLNTQCLHSVYVHERAEMAVYC